MTPRLVRGYDHRDGREHWRTLEEWRDLIESMRDVQRMDYGADGVVIVDASGLVLDVEASWRELETGVLL